jgi:hypothetical protein
MTLTQQVVTSVVSSSSRVWIFLNISTVDSDVTTSHRNILIRLFNDAASHLRRTESAAISLRKTQYSNTLHFSRRTYVTICWHRQRSNDIMLCWSKIFSFLNVFFAHFQPYLICYIIIGIAENNFFVCFVLILLVMACEVSETRARFRNIKSCKSLKLLIRHYLSKSNLEFYCWTILFGFKIKQDQLIYLRIFLLCHIIFLLIWY